MATIAEPLYVVRRGACYIRLDDAEGFVQPGLAKYADHYTAAQAAEAERKVIEYDRSRDCSGGVYIQPLNEALAEDAEWEEEIANNENK